MWVRYNPIIQTPQIEPTQILTDRENYSFGILFSSKTRNPCHICQSPINTLITSKFSWQVDPFSLVIACHVRLWQRMTSNFILTCHGKTLCINTFSIHWQVWQGFLHLTFSEHFLGKHEVDKSQLQAEKPWNRRRNHSFRKRPNCLKKTLRRLGINAEEFPLKRLSVFF